MTIYRIKNNFVILLFDVKQFNLTLYSQVIKIMDSIFLSYLKSYLFRVIYYFHNSRRDPFYTKM